MFRSVGNVYARFTDIFDQPSEEPTAVFSPDGKIEFVQTEDEPSPKLPERIISETKPRGGLRKKVAAFLVLCMVVFVLIIFTLTNLIILLQDRAKISSNSKDVAKLSDLLQQQPAELNDKMQKALSNWSDALSSQLKVELAINPQQIDTAVRNALAKWTEDNLPLIKEELRVKPEEVDSKVKVAMSNWASGNLQKIKDELRVKPEELDNKIQKSLTNWTSVNLPRIKDELRVKQDEIDNRVRQALSNWSREVVLQMKNELKVTPEQLNTSVQTALNTWRRTVLEQLKADLEIKPEVLDSKIQKLLTNMSGDILQRLRTELALTPKLFDDRIEKSLSNLSENLLQRLKEELEISPSQLEDGIRRALSNMTTRALAMLRGICEISYEDKCYWAVKSGPIQFFAAATLCHNNGAEAANIYNEDHYQKMLTYLRNKMAPLTTVWLGMTRNFTAGVNQLENGDVSNYTVSWYPGYPLSRNPSYVNIGIHFEVDVNATRQGFFNDNPKSKRHGILCEL